MPDRIARAGADRGSRSNRTRSRFRAIDQPSGGGLKCRIGYRSIRRIKNDLGLEAEAFRAGAT